MKTPTQKGLMKKTAVFLTVWILCGVFLRASLAQAAVVPPEIKNTVFFIFTKNGRTEVVPSGTAFWVGVKSEKTPDRRFCYLVTASHVLKDENGKLRDSIFIRLNRKDKGADLIEVDLGKQRIFTHPDPSVDLSVIHVVIDESVYDFKMVVSEALVTREIFQKEHITEGDEAFFVGLFANFYGSQRNIPVTRFGRVAMVTDEKISWNGQLMDLYLLETLSFGGNSGAPVFFYLNQTREPGTPVQESKIFLAGIMYGSFLDTRAIGKDEAEHPLVAIQNAGIAAVIPAYKLDEILFSEDLLAMRKLLES